MPDDRTDASEPEDDLYRVVFRYGDDRPVHIATMTEQEFLRYMRDIDKAARKKVLARSGECPKCGGAMTCGQTVHATCDPETGQHRVMKRGRRTVNSGAAEHVRGLWDHDWGV